MNTYADKSQENKRQPVVNEVSEKKNIGESTFQNNRPEAIAQRKLQEMINNSPQTKRMAQLQAMADHYTSQQKKPIQQKSNNPGFPGNLKSSAVQRKRIAVQIVWDTTHVVKKIDRSILGRNGFEEGEMGPEGELKAEQCIEIDDSHIFISRRGPNQEDESVRKSDRSKFPNVKWYRVLTLKGQDVSEQSLYVRNGTFLPLADERNIVERVKAALTLAYKDLSKESIMNSLKVHFATYRGGLELATRDPLFAETMLNEIRLKQSRNWVRKTEIQEVPRVEWVNSELQHWNVRHYTNKVMVQLGKDLGEGYFKVGTIGPPSFTEILSLITLTASSGLESRGGGEGYKTGDQIMLANTTAASSSGHTTSIDWVNIGNVGDTFYGLFYKDDPASGITPNFISEATYYARWTVDQFGVGWASSDWLGTAKDSMKEDGATPEGVARGGRLSDIIASIFPEAPTRDLSASGGRETKMDEGKRKEKFAQMTNFEVKKHGPMTVGSWNEVTTNVGKLRNYVVNINKKAFVKRPELLPSSVRDKL